MVSINFLGFGKEASKIPIIIKKTGVTFRTLYMSFRAKTDERKTGSLYSSSIKFESLLIEAATRYSYCSLRTTFAIMAKSRIGCGVKDRVILRFFKI